MDAKAAYQTILTRISSEQKPIRLVGKYVRWYEGNYAKDGEDTSETLETNYTYAYVDTMAASICPTNPQVSIDGRKKVAIAYAKNREMLANDTFKRDDLATKSRFMASWAAISGYGVSKTVWHFPSGRPRTFLVDPRRFFFDTTVPFEDARYAFEATLVTRQEFEAKAKPDAVGATTYNPEVASRANFTVVPKWLADERSSQLGIHQAVPEPYQMAVVYEFYDWASDKYYHFLDGVEEPLFEGPLPFKYMRNPFEMVVFNPALSSHRGLSDVSLIANSQEHLNQIDSLELAHTYRSIPGLGFDSNSVDDPESSKSALQALNRPGGIVDFKVKSGMNRLTDVLAPLPSPTLSPSFDRMRRQATNSISFILGLPDYQRGAVGGSDLATELALIDEALKTRTGWRLGRMMKWVNGIGRKYIALWREFMTKDEVAVIASPGKPEHLDIVNLGFIAALTPEQAENETWYEFTTVPFSPTENDRLVTLRSLQQWAQVLINNPNVNQRMLLEKILSALGIDGLLVDPEVAQAPAMPQTPAPVGGGGANTPVPGGDTLATGGMPPGLEAIDPQGLIPPAGTADQPKV